MPKGRKINANDIARDIRSHMTDSQIMDKYKLSARGLQSVLKKLLEAGLINQSEYDWRPIEYDDTVIIDFNLPTKD